VFRSSAWPAELVESAAASFDNSVEEDEEEDDDPEAEAEAEVGLPTKESFFRPVEDSSLCVPSLWPSSVSFRSASSRLSSSLGGIRSTVDPDIMRKHSISGMNLIVRDDSVGVTGVSIAETEATAEFID
jgi:hypothetical protein